MKEVILRVRKWRKIVFIGVLLSLAFASGSFTGFPKSSHICHTQVLGASIHVTPSPTPFPSPTTAPIIVINNIIVPTTAPAVVTQAITPTPTQMPSASTPTLSIHPTDVLTPTPTVLPTVTPTILLTPSPTPLLTPTPSIQPTAVPTPTLTPLPTPTVTQVAQNITIEIDYAGEHSNSAYTVAVSSGENAWQAVSAAIGVSQIQYTDYGGSLGIFITGFNGINASANQYYDFQVNGTSSNVGVSSYIVNNHDALKFVLTHF